MDLDEFRVVTADLASQTDGEPACRSAPRSQLVLLPADSGLWGTVGEGRRGASVQ